MDKSEIAEIARYICRNFICSTSCKECGYGSTAREHAEAIVALRDAGPSQAFDEAATLKFWIENPDGDEEQQEFFVGEKKVAEFNHDSHGWQGMRDAAKLFEATAKAVGAKFEKR